jgi:hypothetical protein
MEDEHALWELIVPHFEACKSVPFTFFDFWLIPWPTPLSLATGDGATRTFYVPAKESQGLVVRVDGTPRAASVAAGIGPEGEDAVTFSVADTPASGALLTWTAARARRRFVVWYFGGANSPARIKPIPVEGGLWGVELQLIEEIAG